MARVFRRGESPGLLKRLQHGQKRLRRISKKATVGGVFLSFLKIGVTGFGGGIVVISQIRSLAVRDRKWFTEHEFVEAFALAQSLPGTPAGNTATYIGLRLLGWRGAAAALSGFILPSMLMMIGLAILYRHLRSIPNTDYLFHGLNAAVVALILVTAWRIGRNAIAKRWQLGIAAAACAATLIFRATTVEVVLAAGLTGIYMDSFAERRWQRWRRIRRLAARRRARLRELEGKAFVGGHLTRALAEERLRKMNSSKAGTTRHREHPEASDPVAPGPENIRGSAILSVVAVAMPILTKLALLIAIAAIFLRVGAVTFGGGFVMLPLIENDVVDSKGWLTHQEFADATSLGQLTPGPILITATFIGYRAAGTLGSLVATVSIFLPAFLMTLAAGSYLRKFRANRQVQAFLRGVAPAVVGLLGAAAWSVGFAGIHTWIGVLIMLSCAGVLIRWNPNPFWVVTGAGVARLLLRILVA
jgi:chromate transporter